MSVQPTLFRAALDHLNDQRAVTLEHTLNDITLNERLLQLGVTDIQEWAVLCAYVATWIAGAVGLTKANATQREAQILAEATRSALLHGIAVGQAMEQLRP